MSTLLRFYQAVLTREWRKMIRQKDRFAAAMVRPLLWLWVIGGGMGALAGPDYVLRLLPGIVAMTVLFGGMIGGLSIALDKDAGTMRLLVSAPVHEVHVLIAKAVAASVNACLQTALLVLLLLGLEGVHLAALGLVGQGLDGFFPWVGRSHCLHPWMALGVVLASSVCCALLGLLCGVYTRTIDGYAVMMNFVIFPVFFFSGALYPTGSMPLGARWLAWANPFTYCVDALRHAWAGVGEHSLALDGVMVCVFSALMLLCAVLRFRRGGAVSLFRM